MTPDHPNPGPYLRPMTRWWRRNPYFMHYMLREATALAVGAYAIILTFGVFRLAQGESAWNGWLQALRSPWSLVLHGGLLVAMAIHAQSWFAIMPKTLPTVLLGGRPLAARSITRTGWALSVATSIALLAWAGWWRP